jgi:hypothetical protein
MARISKGTQMKNDAPAIVVGHMILTLDGKASALNPAAQHDPEMMEIEEAKKHFEDQVNAENFWAGRLLANRKSTRIAA